METEQNSSGKKLEMEGMENGDSESIGCGYQFSTNSRVAMVALQNIDRFPSTRSNCVADSRCLYVVFLSGGCGSKMISAIL